MSYMITESEFPRRKLNRTWEDFFFTKPEKKILTLNHYEQVIVSRSVAVKYKLSLYVIP